ncbi:MAG: hypothetical protein WKG00_29685 [Polyangiaceae bacterium]
MMHRNTTFALAFVAAAAGMGCVGDTGEDLIHFAAFAGGALGASNGTYAFESGRGYQVELTRARLHVGAMYLNRSRPSDVVSDTTCTLAGIYVAEVTSGLDVDALNPELQRFPADGFATTERAITGELWLSGGEIDVVGDPTVILDVAGRATKQGDGYPFEGRFTIGANRVVVPSDPALPGREPICKQRVVTPIGTDIVPSAEGGLVLRIDPKGWFGNVDFKTLDEDPGDPALYRFADEESNQASNSLYDGLHASGGVYSFEWDEGGGP